MKGIRLETERFILREFVEEDWTAVHSYGSDPEVCRFMTWGPNTEEDSLAYVRRQIAKQQEEPRQEYELAIVQKEDNQLIGGCSIWVRSSKQCEWEIGYCLRRPSWGQGMTTEVAKALIDFGFDVLKAHRIVAFCDTENIGSWRVMEKAGMRREAHLKENEWRKGKWHDSFLYAILDHERKQRNHE